MVNNINVCLRFLQQIGVCIDDVRASDVSEGSLKAVLSLFFNLSRYKQLQKSAALCGNSSSGSSIATGTSTAAAAAAGAAAVSSAATGATTRAHPSAEAVVGSGRTNMTACTAAASPSVAATADGSATGGSTSRASSAASSRASGRSLPGGSSGGSEPRKSGIAHHKKASAAGTLASPSAGTSATAPFDKRSGSSTSSLAPPSQQGQSVTRSASPGSSAATGIPTAGGRSASTSSGGRAKPSVSASATRLPGAFGAPPTGSSYGGSVAGGIESSTSTSSFSSSSLSSSSRSTSASASSGARTAAAAAMTSSSSSPLQSTAAPAGSGGSGTAGRSGSALDRMYMARRQQTSSAASCGGRTTDAESSGMEGSCENIPSRFADSPPGSSTEAASATAAVSGRSSGSRTASRRTATVASAAATATSSRTAAQRPSKLQMASSGGSGIPRASSCSSRDPSPQQRQQPQSRTPSRENLTSSGTRRSAAASSAGGGGSSGGIEPTSSSSAIPRARSAGKSKGAGAPTAAAASGLDSVRAVTSASVTDAAGGTTTDDDEASRAGSSCSSSIPRPFSANDDRSRMPKRKEAAAAAATASAEPQSQLKSIPKALATRRPRPALTAVETSGDATAAAAAASATDSPSNPGADAGPSGRQPYNLLPGLDTYLLKEEGDESRSGGREAAGAESAAAVAHGSGRRSAEPLRKCITAAPHVISGPQPVSSRSRAAAAGERGQSPDDRTASTSASAAVDCSKNNVLQEASRLRAPAAGAAAGAATQSVVRATQAVAPSAQQQQQLSSLKSDCVTQTEQSALQKIAAQVQKTPLSSGGEKNVLRKEVGNQTGQQQQQQPPFQHISHPSQHSQQNQDAAPTSRFLAPKISSARVATIASLQAKSSETSAAGETGKAADVSDLLIAGTSSDVTAATAIAMQKGCERSRVETTFDVRGEPQTKAFADSTKETTFEASAAAVDGSGCASTQDDLSPSATVKPMQPLSQLASYEFLQHLEATRSANHALAAMAAAGRYFQPQQQQQAIYNGQAFYRFGLMHRSFMTKSSARNVVRGNSSGGGGGRSDDYLSDADSCSAGYMSDVADATAANGGSRHCDDFSGYLSEGGASVYARKMQQRFREGMMAVEECMSRSGRLLDTAAVDDEDDDDDDIGDGPGCYAESFDDGSSISSGDISDIAAGDSAVGRQSATATRAAESGASVHPDSSEPANNELPSVDESGGSRERSDVKRLSSYISNVASSGSGAAQHKNTNALLAADYRGGCIGGTGHSQYSSSGSPAVSRGSDITCGYLSDSGCSYAAAAAAATAAFSAASGHGPAVPPAVWASMTPLARQRLVEQQRARGLISSKTQQSLAASRNHDELYRSSTLGRSPATAASSTSPSPALSALSSDGLYAGGGGAAVQLATRHPSLTCSGGGGYLDHGLGGHPGAFSFVRYGIAGCPQPQQHMSPMAGFNGPQTAQHTSIHAQIQQARALSCYPPGGGGYAVPRSLQLSGQQQQPTQAHVLQSSSSGRAHYASGGQQTTSACTALGFVEGQMLPPLSSRLSVASSGDESRPTCYARNGSLCQASTPSEAGLHQPSTRSSVGSACTSASEEEPNYRSSSQSLVSSTSSMFSTAEEKQAAEIRKLRLELERAKDKVMMLTSQLTSNAHVVQAFQQSLTNMTLRLQQLSTASEQKGSEVTELRATIEHLQRVSGLAQADILRAGSAGSDGAASATGAAPAAAAASLPGAQHVAAPASDRRHSAASRGLGGSGAFSLMRQMSADSINSLNSVNSSASSASHQQLGIGGHRAADGSAASGSSLMLVAASGSGVAGHDGAAAAADMKGKKKKKNNWLRSSFTKAFSRKKSGGSASDAESDYPVLARPAGSRSPSSSSHVSDLSLASAMSAPTSPMHHAAATAAHCGLPAHFVGAAGSLLQQPAVPLSPIGQLGEDALQHHSTVAELKKQLREKELKLTDIRLDALTSAHQLEQLRDAMTKMKNEMSSLKADNERLHRLVGERTSAGPAAIGGGSSSSGSPTSATPVSVSRGLPVFFGQYSNSPAASLSPSSGCVDRIPTALVTSLNSKTSSLDFLNHDANDAADGKRVTVSVANHYNPEATGTYIGTLNVSGKTRWDVLDGQVRKVFKHYLSRVDQSTNLGLTTDSIQGFSVGEVVRTKDTQLPELLPYGYLVGDATNIRIHLKGAEHGSVDSLAFETGIPKSIVQRYVALLLEHRRVVLCGPSGTGKTHLARRLAEHLVARSEYEAITTGIRRIGSTIATFDVEQKSCFDLRQYLTSLREQCESATAVGSEHVPAAVIIDNLHACSVAGSSASLSSAFAGFLSHKHPACPYLICTMTQGGSGGSGSSATNLQLHHNFRWVLCANHMEPVKGLLGRCLRRRLVEVEVKEGVHNNDLCKIVDWIPRVWQHINKCLETYGSVETTVGPQLLMACPMEVASAQSWFIDIWNRIVVPHLVHTIRAGLQTYGNRTCTAWENPADWLRQTYPWPEVLAAGDRPQDEAATAPSKLQLLDVLASDVGIEQSSAEEDPAAVLPTAGDDCRDKQLCSPRAQTRLPAPPATSTAAGAEHETLKDQPLQQFRTPCLS